MLVLLLCVLVAFLLVVVFLLDGALRDAQQNSRWLASQLAQTSQKNNALCKELQEIEQEVGAALGYPLYSDDPYTFPDSKPADGVCTGEHTASTIVDDLLARYRYLQSQQRSLYGV